MFRKERIGCRAQVAGGTACAFLCKHSIEYLPDPVIDWLRRAPRGFESAHFIAFCASRVG